MSPLLEPFVVDGIDEVIKEFLVESYESLDQLDSDLLALEDSPGDRERLGSIFRTVHTIKGTSGFLALPKLERIAHVGENLLVPLRDGELNLDADITDGLLAMVDAIREILAALEQDGSEGGRDIEPLAVRLQQLLDGGNQSDSAAQELPVEQTDVGPTESTEPAIPQTLSDPADADLSEAAQPSADPTTPTAEPIDLSSTPSPSPIAPPTGSAEQSVAQAKAEPNFPTTERSGSTVADSTVRIDVELLDNLMNLVGELVLSRNQILQFCNSSDDAMMVAASQRLNLITTELQEGVMKTRMQPIRNAWNKLPRVVRDLSASCGKDVEVRMEGADTELDKTVLEAIKDPLTHIVRNSVDHGIEAPEVRVANGKPEQGTLLLRAFHEGGQVNIEIADDGGGINAERIRDKAIEKGLVTAQQAAAMTERELTNLILLPGFSTAAQVTNVSGRGVGMDVVKTNIERIGGTLDIQSKPGKGTTLRIKIPLTLAIVPALVVKTGSEQYAIPQVSLLELVRLEGDRAQQEIEFVHDVPVYRLREKLLPLVFLDEQLELRAPRRRDEYTETTSIVVLQAEDRQFGLVVDAITDTQEIVVKPLGHHLKRISTYAGATIMGDGTVSLILDVIGLAQQSGVLTEHRDRSLVDNQLEDGAGSDETEELLIVDSGDGTRAAIRLSTVTRLEEFDASSIESSRKGAVVQYRGQILPLVHISGYGATAGEQGRINTVVFTNGQRQVGVIVGKIVDIVQANVSDSIDNQQTVIHGRVTELIELEQVVAQSLPA